MVFVQTRRVNLLFWPLLLFLVLNACQAPIKESLTDENFLIEWNDLSVETMKTDGINPVLATRIYLYPNVAAYQLIATNSDEFISLHGKLKSLPELPSPEKEIEINLAAITAYYGVMMKLNYREDILTELFEKQTKSYQGLISEEKITASLKYGEEVATLILDWADKDLYKQTKAKPYYTASKLAGSWKPTPPEYREALEPHWGSLRCLTIDSIPAFDNPLALNYSEEIGSPFYDLAIEVYDKANNLTEEEQLQAEFWDDNPDLNNFQGHIPISRRHINPTAHWMSIIGQILRKENLSFADNARVYTLASIAFFDANIVCWENKYKYDLIRPVSYIQEQIDPDWMPILVTPPFPEHTSGHSACSAACAIVLGKILGEPYAFTDSTHYSIGLGVRSFKSFEDAAWEVSRSRFYGGIHYKTGVEQGTEQGFQVGKHIVKYLDL